MLKTEIVLCVRYVVLLAFMIPVLFGCAAPEVERDVEPVVVEEHTRPSIADRRDNEEILRVPLLIGIEEALQEGEPVEADIATVPTIRSSKTEKGAKHNEQLITIHCQNADLLDVLDRIAKISGLTLVVHPGVSGTVTVRLENIPWDQALDTILKANNLRFAIEGNVLRIAPASVFQQESTQRVEQQRQQLEARRIQAGSAPLKTKLISVNFADPSTIANTIQQFLGGASHGNHR